MRGSPLASTIALSISLLWPLSAKSQYADWEECSKSELELIADLDNARAEGRDLRKHFEERIGSTLDDDAEYFLWLFETRPAKTLATVMFGKCALRYPESSPFSDEDLEIMRTAEEKALQELRLKILQQEGRIP